MPHFFQIQANRVGGVAEVLGLFFLLGLGFGLSLGALARNLGKDLDIDVLEAFQSCPEVARRGYVKGQKIIYLIEGQIALFLSEVDETLEILAFVFTLHPISTPSQYRLAQALYLAFADEVDTPCSRLANCALLSAYWNESGLPETSFDAGILHPSEMPGSRAHRISNGSNRSRLS